MGSRDDDMVTRGCQVKAGYFTEQVTSDSSGICGATGWGDGCGKLSELNQWSLISVGKICKLIKQGGNYKGRQGSCKVPLVYILQVVLLLR